MSNKPEKVENKRCVFCGTTDTVALELDGTSVIWCSAGHITLDNSEEAVLLYTI